MSILLSLLLHILVGRLKRPSEMMTVSSAALSLPVSTPPPRPSSPAVKTAEWRSLSNTSNKDYLKVKIQRTGPQRVDSGPAARGMPLLHLLNLKV